MRLVASLILAFICFGDRASAKTAEAIAEEELACIFALTGPAPDREFTIHVGDLSLNPTRMQVRIGSRIVPLIAARYETLEALILAEPALTPEEYGEMIDSRHGRRAGPESMNDPNNLAQAMKRLRDRLTVLFSKEVAARIFPTGSYSYVWLEDEHPPADWSAKLWAHPRKSVIYFGAHPLSLSRHQYLLLTSLMDRTCLGASETLLAQRFVRAGLGDLPPVNLRVHASRLTQMLRRLTGQPEIWGVRPSSESGADRTWAINRELVGGC